MVRTDRPYPPLHALLADFDARARARSKPSLDTSMHADPRRVRLCAANGYLDESELGAAFEALGKPADQATIHHSFTLLDKNHDGMVDLAEFKAMAEQNVVPSLADIFMRDAGHIFEENGSSMLENAGYRRDAKLAKENPKAWCADRCLATGHCEVLEDIYDMSSQQVMSFCDHCAGEDECDLV
jgi:hypothetical protein